MNIAALKPLVPRLALPAIQRTTLPFIVHWDNRSQIDALEEWVISDITFEPLKESLLQRNFLDGALTHVIADEYPGCVNNTHATQCNTAYSKCK